MGYLSSYVLLTILDQDNRRILYGKKNMTRLEQILMRSKSDNFVCELILI